MGEVKNTIKCIPDYNVFFSTCISIIKKFGINESWLYNSIVS